jgi:predicted amidohydrolase YtcJ
MAEPLAAVEAAVTTGSSHEKAAAKQRRLALKEVLKMVSNPGMALEERLKYLQVQQTVCPMQRWTCC